MSELAADEMVYLSGFAIVLVVHTHAFRGRTLIMEGELHCPGTRMMTMLAML